MILREIRVPRHDGFVAERLEEYHDVLRRGVFPAIDELREAGSLLTYNFLSHDQLELRLGLRDDVDPEGVTEVLTRHGIAGELQEYNPAEQGQDRDVLLNLLHHGSELIRALITAPDGPRSLDETLHWVLNQYGLHNVTEAAWHLHRAGASYTVVIGDLMQRLHDRRPSAPSPLSGS